MDITTLIVCLCIGTFCLTTVYWMKSFEKKHRLAKTRRVDIFIQKNKINVSKFFSGYEYDLVHDADNKCIWMFVLRNRLEYKKLLYDDIYKVEYKLDGVVVQSITRTRPSKRELVGAKAAQSSFEIQSFIHLKKEIRAVKELKLTIILDDLQATSLDVIMGSYYFPKELKRMKKNDAQEWFNLFKVIINTEEKRKRA